jgi:hypothetical protein
MYISVILLSSLLSKEMLLILKKGKRKSVAQTAVFLYLKAQFW